MQFRKQTRHFFDKLLGVLASDVANDGMHIIDDIVRTYMFDKLKPTEAQESFEACLEACEAVRQQKLQQLWDAWDERACQGWEQLANIELSDNDMKDVMNTWLHSPEKLMKPWNLAQLPFMKHQDQHQRKKSLFNTISSSSLGTKTSCSCS